MVVCWFMRAIAPRAPAQIAELRDWIAAGASRPPDEELEADPREHWAFRPIRRPALPQVARLKCHPLLASKLGEVGDFWAVFEPGRIVPLRTLSLPSLCKERAINGW